MTNLQNKLLNTVENEEKKAHELRFLKIFVKKLLFITLILFEVICKIIKYRIIPK